DASFGSGRSRQASESDSASGGHLQTRVRYDVDVRRAAARLLAPNIRLGTGSKVAGSRATLIGPFADLFGVVRLVAGPGDDQSSLRSGMHRRRLTRGFELHPDGIRRAHFSRRKEMRGP